MSFIKNSIHSIRTKPLVTAASCIILLDVFIYFLALNHYYFIGFTNPIYKSIFALHFLYIYILLITISKTKPSKVFWSVIGLFFIIPVAVVGWFLFFYSNKVDYYYLTSPESTQMLVIGHSNWTLGETNHYYDFYKNTPIPGVKKMINKESLHIMTRYTNASDLNVLGAYDAKWNGEEKIIFKSQYNSTTINLN